MSHRRFIDPCLEVAGHSDLHSKEIRYVILALTPKPKRKRSKIQTSTSARKRASTSVDDDESDVDMYGGDDQGE